MKRADITDEMIYSAIRRNKSDRESILRSAITDYDNLDTFQKALAGVYLAQMRMAGVKDVPTHDKDVFDYIDAPAKVVIRKMEKMVDEGKLEYGTSLRTAWIVGE